jgi:adenosine deaminase
MPLPLFSLKINKMKEQVSLNNIITNMPKAELHLHIEGTLEPQLMFNLAKKNNIKLPFSSIEEIKKAYKFNNLQEFLDIYYQGANVLRTNEDFYDLTFAYLKKAHEENIVHTEFFFDPQTHTSRDISFETVFNGIYKATKDAEKKYGITSLIIMSFLRHLSEKEAFETLEQSLPFIDKIKAIGLDSSELGNPPEKFERVYKKAKKLGFKLVAHAGEEGPVDYIWSALNLLNIDRVDHGNTSLNDKELVNHLVKNKIALTICPLSNLELKVVKDLKFHPLKKMLDLGMIATVNSDDPAYFGGYINDNFIKITESLNLNSSEIKKLAENSFQASMMDENDKEVWIKKVNTYFKNANA